MDSGADIDGEHRYRLWRVWDKTLRSACFIMLNPSTADATTDDPTIRKCMGFARHWGLGGIQVVNLWSYRATSPKNLKAAGYPNGPRADDVIEATVADPSVCLVVYAWGQNAHGTSRPFEVDRIVMRRSAQANVLKLTKSGIPAHPLYLPYSAVRQAIGLLWPNGIAMARSGEDTTNEDAAGLGRKR